MHAVMQFAVFLSRSLATVPLNILILSRHVDLLKYFEYLRLYAIFQTLYRFGQLHLLVQSDRMLSELESWELLDVHFGFYDFEVLEAVDRSTSLVKG